MRVRVTCMCWCLFVLARESPPYPGPHPPRVQASAVGFYCALPPGGLCTLLPVPTPAALGVSCTPICALLTSVVSGLLTATLTLHPPFTDAETEAGGSGLGPHDGNLHNRDPTICSVPSALTRPPHCRVTGPPHICSRKQGWGWCTPDLRSPQGRASFRRGWIQGPSDVIRTQSFLPSHPFAFVQPGFVVRHQSLPSGIFRPLHGDEMATQVPLTSSQSRGFPVSPRRGLALTLIGLHEVM